MESISIENGRRNIGVERGEGGRRGEYYFPVHQEEMNFRLGVWKERRS